MEDQKRRESKKDDITRPYIEFILLQFAAGSFMMWVHTPIIGMVIIWVMFTVFFLLDREDEKKAPQTEAPLAALETYKTTEDSATMNSVNFTGKKTASPKAYRPRTGKAGVQVVQKATGQNRKALAALQRHTKHKSRAKSGRR